MSEPVGPDDLGEDIVCTHRYVVPEDGRKALAWASARYTLLHSPGHRVFYVAIVAFAVLVQTLEGGWDDPGRALQDVFYIAFAGVVLTVVWACTVGYAQTYHSTRDRFFPGAVLESGFGESEMALRGPTGDTRLPYAGLRRVRAVGDFAFISTDGLGGQAVFPRALFPDEEIARINATGR